VFVEFLKINPPPQILLGIEKITTVDEDRHSHV
jgi:hypothetical protein